MQHADSPKPKARSPEPYPASVRPAITLLAVGWVGLLGSFAGLLLTHPDGVGVLINGYFDPGTTVGWPDGRVPTHPSRAHS